MAIENFKKVTGKCLRGAAKIPDGGCGRSGHPQMVYLGFLASCFAIPGVFVEIP